MRRYTLRKDDDGDDDSRETSTFRPVIHPSSVISGTKFWPVFGILAENVNEEQGFSAVYRIEL